MILTLMKLFQYLQLICKSKNTSNVRNSFLCFNYKKVNFKLKILDPFDEYETTIKYSAILEKDSNSGFETKIRAGYNCLTNCAKATHKNDIYWFVQGSNEYFHYENKRLDLDSVENQLFTQIDEEKWSQYPNKNIFCLIYPIINNKRSAIPFKTEYFFIGFMLEIDNKKVNFLVVFFKIKIRFV